MAMPRSARQLQSVVRPTPLFTLNVDNTFENRTDFCCGFVHARYPRITIPEVDLASPVRAAGSWYKRVAYYKFIGTPFPWSHSPNFAYKSRLCLFCSTLLILHLGCVSLQREEATAHAEFLSAEPPPALGGVSSRGTRPSSSAVTWGRITAHGRCLRIF